MLFRAEDPHDESQGKKRDFTQSNELKGSKDKSYDHNIAKLKESLQPHIINFPQSSLLWEISFI